MAKKRKNASPFLIGLFVILGTVIMAGAIIWLGAGRFLQEQIYYVTYFDSSVEGLEQGSAVKYQGVPCGRIASINVAPDGRLVEVVMQINRGIDVNDSLRVQPALSGIAGGRFLQLHYPTSVSVAEMHPEINFKPPFPVIKSAPSGFEEMTLAAREVLNNLIRLDVEGISMNTVKFLKSTTDFFASEDLNTILKNLAEASIKLDNILLQADTSSAISNINETTKVLYQTSLQLNRAVASLDKQINDANIPYYIGEMYLRYDSTMQHTNQMIGSVGFRAQSSILTLQETLDEIRRTNRDLQNALRALSDDPASIFLTAPPPRER